MDKEKDGYSTDDSGKRRREDNDEMVFLRSKKTGRTPERKQSNSDIKLDKILNLMHSMNTEILDIKREMKEMREEQKDFKQEIVELKRENEVLKNKYEQTKNENEIMKKEIYGLKKDFEWIEKEKKENNVVITGLPIKTTNPNTLKKEVNDFIRENLEINIEIQDAHKINEKTCSVKLKDAYDKKLVMENKRKLKNIQGELIYINNDLTRREKEMKVCIKKRAEEEKQNGKTVKIKFSKLIIEGQEWKYNRLKGELEPKN